ncbi:DUF3566 domain-containing protein [Bailinhaonella thermotolerans]|uniref:DUF3566 domain-containing protein n=1 Tax=Bailinhaonella thermotolerans TaxID=1070861 RepID=A0A3A4AV67_9ACTN|nr:DUF3566 domain-containing protein [Bailinhaonella thermotolerans]RJL32165.1 DUF3566 domain-containing protein [Bailinhaonella thermotolerans]
MNNPAKGPAKGQAAKGAPQPGKDAKPESVGAPPSAPRTAAAAPAAGAASGTAGAARTGAVAPAAAQTPTRPAKPAAAATTAAAAAESGKEGAAGSRAPRKAHLVLRRVEPWSMMKFSFVVSLVCFVILFVAVAVLYGVLSALGVFDSIAETVNTLLSNPEGKKVGDINAHEWFSAVRILGYTALLGALNVVLITALSTVGSVIYNVVADLVGGVELTFSEAE